VTSGGATATRDAIGRSPIAKDVVLITTHDIGRHLHCYGNRTVRSPQVDALAASGVLFTRAFCTAPQCSPSRASLASGRYPHNNGVMGLAHHGFDWELAVPHAASLFEAAGFEAHLFGGQHVSLHPETLGFSAVHGDASGEVVAQQVEELLERSHDKRLYVEINLAETHRPYPQPPPDPLVDVPRFLEDTPEARDELAALQAAIETMDVAAGRVLAALERAGRADNALVVFTTDHGLAMPRAKCTLYDPGIEVALIARWPRGGLHGVRDDLVSNIDVLPTLLEAAGLEIPPEVQGHSLLDGDGQREVVFAEKTFHSYYDPMRAIRTHRYKFIRNFETAFRVEVPGDIQTGPIFRADPARYSTDRPAVVELYDMEEDPLEQHNLAGSEAVKEVEAELSERLWAWMRETDDPLLNGPVASPRYRLAMQR